MLLGDIEPLDHNEILPGDNAEHPAGRPLIRTGYNLNGIIFLHV
jgi:hypothetical protein